MRVDRSRHPATAGASRPKRAGAAFAVAVSDAPVPTLSDADAPCPAAALLRVAPPTERAAAAAPPLTEDSACAAHGRALLGALAGLQLATLGGAGAHARQTLAGLARALPASADPGLDAVLQAIAQRAAIELARAG